jgi:hypothetical protein
MFFSPFLARLFFSHSTDKKQSSLLDIAVSIFPLTQKKMAVIIEEVHSNSKLCRNVHVLFFVERNGSATSNACHFGNRGWCEFCRYKCYHGALQQMHSNVVQMLFYSNISECSFCFRFKELFFFFSAQGVDEAMLRVTGTMDSAANVTFGTNNDLVDRIYEVFYSSLAFSLVQ